MSSSTKHLKNIAQRLKSNYEDCEISQSNDTLIIKLSIGKIQVKRKTLSAFIDDKLVDEITFENEDDLYDEIEAFIFVIQDEEKKCNTLFNTVNENTAKLCRNILCISGVLEVLIFLAYHFFNLPFVFLLLALVLPFVAVILLRFARLNKFSKDWVCPHCHAKLPLSTKEFIPQVKAVSLCPDCHKSLLDENLVKQSQQEMISEYDDVENIEYNTEYKKCGENKICAISSIVLILFAVFLFFPITTAFPEKSSAFMVIGIATLICIVAMALSLIFCKVSKTEHSSSPKIVVYEQKWLSIIGIILGIIGLAFILCSFVVNIESLFGVVFIDMLGLLSLITAVWMLLAQKNRTLSIYSSFIIYTTSFGKVREFDISQISSVKFTSSQSIKFLDQNNKKLFSVETNMVGAYDVIDWVSNQTFSVDFTKTLEKRVDQTINEEMPVSWSEEYRTPLHNYLGAIRIGLSVMMVIYVLGCLGSLPLYFVADIKMSHTVYLTAFAPLALILFYIAFAPVLLLGDYPKCATEEWKSMYIKFPTSHFIFFSIIYFAQIYYLWALHVIQIADVGRFALFSTFIAVLLISLCFIRTPKKLRKGDDFAIMILSLFLLSSVISYGLNLAISTHSEHYTAVVVERTEPTAENKDDDYTLTIVLDDGKTKKLNVTEQEYNLEKSGVEFVVCQKENFLGIRMVRLHLPEGTTLASLLTENKTS